MTEEQGILIIQHLADMQVLIDEKMLVYAEIIAGLIAGFIGVLVAGFIAIILAVMLRDI